MLTLPNVSYSVSQPFRITSLNPNQTIHSYSVNNKTSLNIYPLTQLKLSDIKQAIYFGIKTSYHPNCVNHGISRLPVHNDFVNALAETQYIAKSFYDKNPTILTLKNNIRKIQKQHVNMGSG